jgi:Uma2 family endonuclease
MPAPLAAVMVGHVPLPRSAEEVQIMGMPVPQPITTIEELLALPEDGLRHELLDGEHVVTPAPRPAHERLVMELWLLLRNAIGEHGRVEVFGARADLRLSPRTLVQPDVFLIQNPAGVPIRDWSEAPVPLLAVEVLSPSTAAQDRGPKRRLYLEAGVEEYWIVDIDARLIERWRQGDDRPEIVDQTLEWSLSAGVSGSVDLARLFAKVGS